MTLRPAKPRPLNWDPSDTETEEGESSRFEWAIDHEYQGRDDWCWAACLRNALTSIGRYPTRQEIRDRYLRSKGKPLDLEPIKNERIDSPGDVPDLWRWYGYAQAEPSWVDGPLCFDELAKELATHGPVQIELWRENAPGDRHLALIYGVRETKEGLKQVCVSDPAEMGTDPPRPYDQMRKADPLGGNHGEWRRTYFNLGIGRGRGSKRVWYLQRFFGCPTKYLGRLELKVDIAPDDAPVLDAEEPVESKLQLKRPPSLPRLPRELALASYGYRHYRYRNASDKYRKHREAELRRPLFLHESIPVWKPRGVINYNENLIPLQLSTNLWHHQIHGVDGASYYAHACFSEELHQRAQLDKEPHRRRFGSGWRTVWMGERWAKPIHAALRQLEREYKDLEDEVRMFWLERRGLVTLHLAKSNLHMVAISSRKDQGVLKPLETYTDEKLREILSGL